MGLVLMVGKKDVPGATVIYGSYTWFSHFREAVASAAGIELRKMRGFGGRRSWDRVDDPIVPFLDHSDCEGEISAAKCAKIWPRLAELAAELTTAHNASAHDIIGGMKRCVAQKKPLVFR